VINSINIENFQSHKNTNICLHKNINVINGLSDSGKSGFIRAIDSVVRKTPFYLKYGEKFGHISLNINDKEITRYFDKTILQKCPVCKEKIQKETQVCKNCGELIPINSSSDYYKINEEKYEKFGAKIPDYINEQIRIYPINFVDKEIFINLAKQHDDFFFIGSSYDNLRNKMISSLIIDSEKIDNLVKIMNSEKLSTSESLKVTKKDFDNYSKKIIDTQDLYTECEHLILDIEFEKSEVNKIDEKCSKLRSYKTMFNELQVVLDNIQLIKIISEKITKTIILLDKIINIESQRNNLIKIKNALIILSSFDKIKFVKFDSELIKTIQSLIDFGNKYMSIFQINNDLKILKKLDGIEKQNFDINIHIQELELKINTRKTLILLQSDLNNFQNNISEKLNISKKIKLLMDKINQEVLNVIDESICPITKEKYCESCIRVLKNEHIARFKSK